MFGGQGGSGGGNNPPPYPFGQPTTTASTGFGQPTSGSTGMFGQSLGGSAGAFGQSSMTSTGLFGSNTATSSSGMFGSAGAPSTAVFGQSTASSSGNFGSIVGAFGQPATSPSGSFGQHTVSGTTATFGQPTAGATGMFGQPSFGSGGTFGQSLGSAPFGQPITITAGTFNQPTTTNGMFGQPSASSHGQFGQPATTSSSMFGQLSASSGGTFGQSSASFTGNFGSATTQASAFGQSATSPQFGQVASGSSPFGQPNPAGASFGQTGGSVPAIFGQAPTSAASGSTALATSSGNLFGQTASSAIFGQTSTSAAPVFGQTATTAAPAATFAQAAAAGATFAETAPSSSVGFGRPGGAPASGAAAPAAPATASVSAAASQAVSASVRSLFAAEAARDAAPASRPADPPAVLFGKDRPATGAVFGKTDKPQAAGHFGQAEPAGERQRTASLFGKTEPPDEKQRPAPLFGKAEPADEKQRPAALFGKSEPPGAKRPTASLFGKTDPPAERDPPAALFGKTEPPGVKRSAATLFGKTEDEPADASAEPDRPAPAAGERRPAKSVFARPDPDSPRPRRPAPAGAAEASRRALSRTGLFGKPTEPRSPGRPAGSVARSSPRLERLESVEERQDVTSLLCTEVPEGYNDRNILTRHFAKFGQVTRVSCNKTKNTAAIHFADHASAEAAKKRGMKVHPKVPPMSLYFLRQKSWRRQSGSSKEPESPSADVSDELRAMSGTGDVSAPAAETKPRRRLAPAAASAASAPAAAAAAAPAAAESAPTAALNVAELRALLRQPAATASERYRVLDARDKLHRAELRREQAARSGPLVGTCPDMCPEKERYMREEKHQISATYERDRDGQGPFEMDHRLAVKQYSRSSADQEEPLPHELRTPAALLLTMDYLVMHVIDSETRDTGDWFHFIWDRTRGIRKDITQQQLTDPVSVGLVEKCARFHVHCASALCELPRDTFDQKINNENLTKCLQTLKHMYHDLSLRDIQCPREAEFRAYDILLNLNQGDILREVQTYSDAVRESSEVQSALRLYVALSTNNYVRFFKLVRRADYLQSCLLQRYFNQVRTRALDIITRTFCPPKKLVEFPLSELQHILGFESELECASVLRQHGVESEEGTAFLDRSLFQLPDAPADVRRCPTLIDSKLGTLYGQVINGAPLPADPLPGYRPHSSFDEHQVLRRAAWGALDQRRDAAEPPPPQEEEQERLRRQEQEQQRRETAAQEAAAAAAAGQLLEEVVRTEARRTAAELVTVAGVVQSLRTQLYRDTMFSVTDEIVREVCQTELKEARRQQELEQQRQRIKSQQDQELKERLSAVLTETLIAEVCLEETDDIAKYEMQVVENEKTRRLEDRVSAAVCSDLWTEEAERLAWETAVDVITDCHRQRAARDQAAAEIGHRLSLRRMLARWRLAVEAGRRLRAEQSRFPPRPPLHSAETALQLLGGRRPEPHPPADLRADQSLCRLLLEDRLQTQRVSLSSVLAPLAGDLTGDVLWKLAVAAAPGWPLADWLHDKLSDGEQRENGVLQLCSVPASPRCRLELVARSVCGRTAEAVGSAGLVLPVCGRPEPSRLSALLGRLPGEPLLPLAVVAPPGGRPSAVAGLGLIDCIQRRAVSTYRVFEVDLDDALQSNQTLVSILEWLFDHRPAVPPLQNGIIRHVVEDFVAEEVTRLMYNDLHMRRNKKRVEQSPAALIALFNGAVCHLATVFSSDSLPDVSWPPAELADSAAGRHLPPANWNRPARLLRIRESVEKLALPCLEVGEDWDWTDGCSEALQYVRALSEPGQDCAPLICRVQYLLRGRLRELEEAAWPLYDDATALPLAASLPWTDIVQSCMELQMSKLSSTETVYFLPDELAHFRVPDCWAELTSTGRTNESLTLDASIAIAKRPLEASLESETSKRRTVKSSSPRLSLDISATISREMDVSLSWEDRLRELVDQGDHCTGGLLPLSAPSPPSPPRCLAGLTSPRRPVRPPLAVSRLRRSPPAAPVAPARLTVGLDRPQEERRRCDLTLAELRPEPSLARRLAELRDGLAEDRRSSGDWTRRLAEMSASDGL